MGYFLKNWANYFSNLLVTLEEEKAERKKIKNTLRGFPQMFNNDECFFLLKKIELLNVPSFKIESY